MPHERRNQNWEGPTGTPPLLEDSGLEAFCGDLRLHPNSITWPLYEHRGVILIELQRVTGLSTGINYLIISLSYFTLYNNL